MSRRSHCSKRMRRKLIPATVAFGLLLIAAHFGLKFVPIPPALLRPSIQSIALLDRNGIPLREARVAERFSREIALAEVPPHVIDAVLAAEDKRFYRHHGIDWIARPPIAHTAKAIRAIVPSERQRCG